MNSAELQAIIVGMESIPDDSVRPEVWFEVRTYTGANRRGRRTHRRSKRRKAWLREREAFLHPSEYVPTPGRIPLVASGWWVLQFKAYYNIDREL